MIKIGSIRRNNVDYGIRDFGYGIDIIDCNDDYVARGISTIQEAVKLVELDSALPKWDELRQKYIELYHGPAPDTLRWPKG